MPRIGPIEVTIDCSAGIVTIVSHSDPTIEEWLRALDEIIADPAFRPGFGFISDRRGVPTPASPGFVRDAAQYLARHPEVFAGVPWAVLVDSPVAFGMARMGQAYVSEAGPQVEIFRDSVAAWNWLSGLLPTTGTET